MMSHLGIAMQWHPLSEHPGTRLHQRGVLATGQLLLALGVAMFGLHHHRCSALLASVGSSSSIRATSEALCLLCNCPLPGSGRCLEPGPLVSLGTTTPLGGHAVIPAPMITAPGQEAEVQHQPSVALHIQIDQSRGSVNLLHSSCALPPILRSSPCLSSTMLQTLPCCTLMPLPTMISLLEAMHLSHTLLVGEPRTGCQWVPVGMALGLLRVALLSNGKTALSRP